MRFPASCRLLSALPAFALLSLLLACTTTPSPAAAKEPQAAAATPTSTWLEDVSAIGAHRDSDGRRDAIRKLLQASALPASETPFTHEALRGTNVLSRVSGTDDQPLLLLGGHYDQVGVGNGITDNAAGSAVVLALARRLHARPLQHHRVVAAFWDLEEEGLLGARAYVGEGGEKPALYVNFDVFGWGDTLWMMSPDPGHPLVAGSAEAARAQGIGFSGGDKYPPTDHLAFLKAGWPAVSYSLVGGDEIGPILQVFAGEELGTLPKVMQVIHSPGDTLEHVDAAQVEAGIDAVEAALRAWDAGHGG